MYFTHSINVSATLSSRPTLPFSHSTGGSAQFSVMTERGGMGRVGGRSKREGIYAYI